jgi:hypothetical protein
MDVFSDEFDATVSEDEPLPRTLDMDIDVTFQKKRFTTLHLEEPTAGQMERAELEVNTATPTPYTLRRFQIALIAGVAKVPREVVLQLRNSEVRDAFDFLSALLAPTPKDGGT